MDAEASWEGDAADGVVTQQRFCDSLFELADVWVDTIDGEEYAAFLEKLFYKIFRKVVHHEDDGGGLSFWSWRPDANPDPSPNPNT